MTKIVINDDRSAETIEKENQKKQIRKTKNGVLETVGKIKSEWGEMTQNAKINILKDLLLDLTKITIYLWREKSW